eukprot:465300_1
MGCTISACVPTTNMQSSIPSTAETNPIKIPKSKIYKVATQHKHEDTTQANNIEPHKSKIQQIEHKHEDHTQTNNTEILQSKIQEKDEDAGHATIQKDMFSFDNTDFVEKCSSISQCPSIRRIIKYLKIYQTMQPHDLYRIFVKENAPHFDNDYNHVLFHHLSDYKPFTTTASEYESIYNHIINNVQGCKLESCIKYQRNNRNRETKNILMNDKQNENQNENQTQPNVDIENAYFMEALDTLHCFFLHTFDVGFRIKATDLKVETDDNDDDDEQQNILQTKQLLNLIHSKREKLQNIRGASSIANSKFVSKVTSNKTDIKTGNDDVQQSFMDKLYDNLSKTFKVESDLNAFHDFLMSEQYDSEAVQYDIMGNDGLSSKSNICNYINNEQFEFLTKFTNKHKSEEEAEQEAVSHEYSFGFRYEYVAKPTFYSFDEYIVKKYEDLFDELLNNNIYHIDAETFNITKKKAQGKLDTNYARSLAADGKDGDIQWNPETHATICKKFYGVIFESCITVEHLMAVLFYTDYSDLSYHFSSTFRALNESDTFETNCQRNSEYAHWSNLLCQAVNCFGPKAKQGAVYYHGINKMMIFKSFTSYYNSPTSTTFQKSVAAIFAAETGAILQLKRCTDVAPSYFNCCWLSSYSNEDERIFVMPVTGGSPRQKLRIASIISVSTKTNYKFIIHAITSLYYGIIPGWLGRHDGFKIKKKDVKILKNLIARTGGYPSYAY